MLFLSNIELQDDLPYEYLRNVYSTILDKNGAKIYVQVCLTINDENMANTAFGNLLKIEDNYPKYVITLNDVLIGQDNNGINSKKPDGLLTSEL
jgi:uncharacterized protein